MCAFGDAEAKAVLNEVIEKVSTRKGVKRTLEDLVGEETFSKNVERLWVPDWILLNFKTKARISYHQMFSLTMLADPFQIANINKLCFFFLVEKI